MDRTLLLYLPSQTGDLPHVAAALRLDTSLDVLLLCDSSNDTNDVNTVQKYLQRQVPATSVIQRVRTITVNGDGPARSLYDILQREKWYGYDFQYGDQQWTEFYRVANMGLASNKAKPVKYDVIDALMDIFTISTDKSATKKPWRESTQQPVVVVDYPPTNCVVVGYSTSTVAFAFGTKRFVPLATKQQISKDLSSTLGDDTMADFDLAALFTKVPDGKKPVLLLWSRYSGSNTATGYNAEGDSDVQGQKDIYDIASKTFDVVTIGHDNVNTNSDKNFHSEFHLGPFYLSEQFNGKGREAQVAFLTQLMKAYPKKLFQIGQKTGGMDGGALVGIPTIYIEDVKSIQQTRMIKWTRGVVPFYRCALIDEPPTLLGRALRSRWGSDDPGFQTALTTDPTQARRAIQLLYLAQLRAPGNYIPMLSTFLKSAPANMKEDAWKVKLATAQEDVNTYMKPQPPNYQGYSTKAKGLIKTQLDAIYAAYNSGKDE